MTINDGDGWVGSGESRGAKGSEEWEDLKCLFAELLSTAGVEEADTTRSLGGKLDPLVSLLPLRRRRRLCIF